MNNIKCCIYTRDFLESPYLNFFIEHYIKLGFDKIFILKTDDYNYDLKYKSQVEIHKVENLGNIILQKYDYLIKNSGFDWVLSVDIDEILVLHKKYNNNIKSYIFEKINENNTINSFYFRWGMIEKYDNNTIKAVNILNVYNVFQNTHIKSMVKISLIKNIDHNPHIIILNEKLNIYFENNILNKNKSHAHPITDDSYQESILIHLHTRSVNNIIIKSLNTKLGKKNINSSGNFKNFIELIDNYKSCKNKSSILQEFKTSIGLKARLPFHHTKKCPIIQDSILNNYTIDKYDNPIIDIDTENNILKKILIMNNIDYNKYIEFIKNIHFFFE